MIDLSSFRGSRFPPASVSGCVVVKGLDLNRRIDSWPDGNVGLLRVRAHSRFGIYNEEMRRAKRSRCCALLMSSFPPFTTWGVAALERLRGKGENEDGISKAAVYQNAGSELIQSRNGEE